jgi:hypothetical protein
MNLLSEDYSIPSVRTTIKLTLNESENARAPKYKGFVVINRSILETLLLHVEKSPTGTLFANVALWPARDEKYALEGSVEVKAFEEAVTLPTTPAATNGEVDWY